MKKLFNSRFLFILASSLVVLILLTVGAFYLFEDEDDFFVKGGYVLNPLSSTSEKYFFNEKAGYKENLSSMIEFEDVDKNTVSVLKDSFVHYLDDSLSLLKNGAILDLDSVKGDKAVSFYNITSESIIEKKDNGYVIESANGEIVLKNFIARISEDKYIVVGNLNLKMAGNSTVVQGDYFEIVYVEAGVVNIENKDVKYQVTAEGTVINVGSDKVIDLGDKKITVSGKDVMSITSITIDGDENIEIIPKGDEEDNSDDEPGQDNENPNLGNNENPGVGGDENENPGTGDGEGGENIESEPTEDVVISLKNADIGSTDIDLVFDIVGAAEDDSFVLQVVNLASGKTHDMALLQVLPDVNLNVSLLSPNTKYLFMVVNQRDNGKYFQKVMETTGFGLKLEKMYATDSSLAYKLIVEDGVDVSRAKLTLKVFNEETKQIETATATYLDSALGEVKTEQVKDLNDLKPGEYVYEFTGLESDTIYNVVLDEFSFVSTNFKDIYNISLSSMTLKRTPDFSEMSITKDVSDSSFALSLGNVTDPDNAIVGYRYMIYDYLDDSLVIEKEHTNASPLNVKIGDKEGQLSSDTNYYYRVIIEYFDNEKYIEYITDKSYVFMMGNEPYITVVPNEEKIGYNQIGYTVYLIDNSCLISMPGRDRCSGPSKVNIELYEKSSSDGGEGLKYKVSGAVFTVEEDVIKYEGVFKDLKPGTTYMINVRALYNSSDSIEEKDLPHTEDSKYLITTKSLASFNVEWSSYESSSKNVVNVGSKYTFIEDDDVLSPEETLASVDKVVLKLYSGRSTTNLDEKIPIRTRELYSSVYDFKKILYDDWFKITTEDTFKIDIDGLGKLSEYYTISMEAWTGTGQQITLVNNVYSYRINPTLYNPLSEPFLGVTGVMNSAAGNIFKDLSGSTYVAYDIQAAFNRTEMEDNAITPQKINYYVYGADKKKLNFYVQDKNDELVLVDKLTIDLNDCVVDEDKGELCQDFTARLFMDYGVSYYQEDDNVMRRGTQFYVGYEIVANSGGQSILLPTTTDNDAPSDFGKWSLVKNALKQNPVIEMYVSKSDENSITYNYTLTDIDNAVYKEQEAENYSFYVDVNVNMKRKIDMVKIEGEGLRYNKFAGTLTINNLVKGDMYDLYYKINVNKTGDEEDDIVPYLGSYGVTTRMFDGFYDSEQYAFNYQIINDPINDNKVVIKVLAADAIVNRILSYKITFKDSKGNDLEKELWELSACDGNEQDIKCLEVDYRDLNEKGMKSTGNEINLISTKVEAFYDSGLVGYDMDYQYMIMQDNSSADGAGAYIIVDAAGQASSWKATSGSAIPGYYTYDFVTLGLSYKNQSKSTSSRSMTMKGVALTSDGYLYKEWFLNPKVISVDEMTCNVSGEGEACNTFSFSSITPKVRASSKTPLINGSIQSLKLSGVDLNDFKNEGTSGNPEYYLYVEVWENVDDVGNLDKVSRPTVKVKIDNDKPTNAVNAVIDGLKEYTETENEYGQKQFTGMYYYNVYAYMYKNSKVTYTQLFDAGTTNKNEVKTYSLKSLKGSDVFNKIESVSYRALESDKAVNYGDREINTTFKITPYGNNTPFNYEFVYVLCETTDANNGVCGPEDDDVNIFKHVVPSSEITSTDVKSSVNISEYDLEYNKNYNLYVYAYADYYDGDNKTQRYIILNPSKSSVTLLPLSEPSFVISREAVLINGEYGIDFEIETVDSDRTLVNGNYFVELLGANKSLVGSMQLLDGKGNVVSEISNYNEYAFDAFVPTTNVRIMGLEPDTVYTFNVYGDAYMNNYNPDIPKENRTYKVLDDVQAFSTNTYGVAFGSVNYGITSSTIVINFEGGSNFSNVKWVQATVIEGIFNKDDETGEAIDNGKKVTKYYEIGKNNKYFEKYAGTDNWIFVVDGLTNTLGNSYTINISFGVKDPLTGEEVKITSADYENFEDTILYTKESENSNK